MLISVGNILGMEMLSHKGKHMFNLRRHSIDTTETHGLQDCTDYLDLPFADP